MNNHLIESNDMYRGNNMEIMSEDRNIVEIKSYEEKINEHLSGLSDIEDKYLEKKTIRYMSEMITLCIEPYRSYRIMLISMMNGKCKDRIFITLMNYLASNDFNECPTEIECDGTVWSWCKWAVATIKSREQTRVTCHELKMIKTEKIGKKVMNLYLTKASRMMKKDIMIHKTLLVEAKIREKTENSDSTIDIIIANNEIDSTL